jgi:hypothetical protein
MYSGKGLPRVNVDAEAAAKNSRRVLRAGAM